jgi:hypothetical protein
MTIKIPNPPITNCNFLMIGGQIKKGHKFQRANLSPNQLIQFQAQNPFKLSRLLKNMTFKMDLIFNQSKA